MPNTNKRFGFVRVATAVPQLQVADCTYNAKRIAHLMAQAQKQEVSVLVFPELSVTGYTCADLFQQQALLQGAKKALLEIIIPASQEFVGLTIIGMPLAVDNALFNCALVLKRGEVLGIVPKSYPPGYKEYYEHRWFSPGCEALSKTMEFGSQQVPFGTDLIFKAADVEGLAVGVEICEDLWVPVPPSSFLALAGATVIANLSASNVLVSKAEYRRQLVMNQSGRCRSAYVYTSSGVHESTTDVVFSGHQLIAENGILLAESNSFNREDSLTLADIDIERLLFDRCQSNSFLENKRHLGANPTARIVEFHAGQKRSSGKLLRVVDAHPFVPQASESLKEHCEEIFAVQVAGLTKRLECTRTEKVTIGVSGGLDSTLALLVTCKAFDVLGLPRTNITGYTMPGFGTTANTKKNAHTLMQHLGVTAKEVDIRNLCFEQMKQMEHKPFGLSLANLTLEAFCTKIKALPETDTVSDPVFENVQARTRTKILMDSGFTIGTGDLSELALGWCTYNADHMSMYNVNVSIPKTLVKFLVRWAAENEFDGPVRQTLIDISKTEISPELLPPGKNGEIKQKTESIIGPFELHDFFLYYMLRFGFSPEKIFFLTEQAHFDVQYARDEVLHWLKVFIVRFFNSQFKRSCLPDGQK